MHSYVKDIEQKTKARHRAMSSMQGARERGIERNVRIREAETYLNINGEEAETETKREFAKKVIFVKGLDF